MSTQRAAWKRIGSAEKVWVLSHPFVAKKAFRVTQSVLEVMDSFKGINYFEGNTESGSKADAARHAYWMAELTGKIGKRRSLKLGNANEKRTNEISKKGRLEKQFLPDYAAMQMYLKKNAKGAEIGQNTAKPLDEVLKSLQNGEIFWIKQNKKGEFLDRNNQVIPFKEWSGKSENERVLVLTSL